MRRETKQEALKGMGWKKGREGRLMSTRLEIARVLLPLLGAKMSNVCLTPARDSGLLGDSGNPRQPLLHMMGGTGRLLVQSALNSEGTLAEGLLVLPGPHLVSDPDLAATSSPVPRF